MAIVYLHIGAPKTATSTLQSMLAGNFEQLLKQGVLYPKLLRHGDAHHTLVADLIQAYQGHTMADLWYGDRTRGEAWQNLQREIEQHPGIEKIILSSELFFGQTQRLEDMLADIRSRLSEHELKVVVYLRRQDKLYSSFGVKPFMGANSGLQMGGWFKKEIKTLDDLKGLKMRIPGLGGAILEKLGGVPTSLPPGEIFTALQSGLIDGTEFLGPWADSNFGFQKVAPYYYFPGFHEPNGTGECLVNKTAFENLPAHLQNIVENACMAENSYALAETEWFNAEALQKLVNVDGVKLRQWPDEILKAARIAGEEVLDKLAKTDTLSGEIVASYRAARARTSAWSKVGHLPFYAARDI